VPIYLIVTIISRNLSHFQQQTVKKHVMIALKPLLLALLAGTSSAFAVMQPKGPTAIFSKTTALKKSGVAASIIAAATADASPPELKVMFGSVCVCVCACVCVCLRK
jgi:hypothetical protein